MHVPGLQEVIEFCPSLNVVKDDGAVRQRVDIFTRICFAAEAGLLFKGPDQETLLFIVQGTVAVEDLVHGITRLWVDICIQPFQTSRHCYSSST
jgi:hypothetical protein